MHGWQLAAVILLLVHAFATWMMVGIIFFVQVVYLPLYRRFKGHLSNFEKKDLVHMGYLVGPLFFFETISAIILAFIMKENFKYRILAFSNLGLLILIWLVSWFLRWRYRKRDDKDEEDFLFIRKMHHILLTSNWFRTICWSLRGIIVLLMLFASKTVHP